MQPRAKARVARHSRSQLTQPTAVQLTSIRRAPSYSQIASRELVLLTQSRLRQPARLSPLGSMAYLVMSLLSAAVVPVKYAYCAAGRVWVGMGGGGGGATQQLATKSSIPQLMLVRGGVDEVQRSAHAACRRPACPQPTSTTPPPPAVAHSHDVIPGSGKHPEHCPAAAGIAAAGALLGKRTLASTRAPAIQLTANNNTAHAVNEDRLGLSTPQRRAPSRRR